MTVRSNRNKETIKKMIHLKILLWAIKDLEIALMQINNLLLKTLKIKQKLKN